jgi:cyclohexa-1,5-dienecarbonyl-CoA hydratase
MPVQVEISDRVARLTLSAPPLNILTSALQDELRQKLAGLSARNDHNAVLIRSGLPGVFSAGADVAEHVGGENCRRMLASAHALIAEVLRCPVPTVCVVDGRCLGGAFELALACDQIVASAKSVFATPEITLGCYPPAALVLMPQKLPAMLAATLIQQGREVTAQQLSSAGVQVGDDEQALASAAAARFGGLPRGPLVQATRLLRAGAAERFIAQVGGIGQVYLEQLLQLHDAKEGPEAFLAKRKPVWRHS